MVAIRSTTRALKLATGVALAVLLAACSAGAPAPAATTAPAATSAPAALATSAPAATTAPAAPTAPAAEPPLSPPVKVKVGDQMFAPLAPVYIAYDNGYFQAEGLDVELVAMPNTSQIIPSLATGDLAFASIGADPFLFNALTRGVDIRLLASIVNNGPTDRPAALILRSELLDSGKYTSPSDLKGLKFGIPGPQGRFYVNRMLVQGGLTDDDVSYTQMGLPDMVAALQSGAIDGAWEVEPLVTLAQRQGIARPIATTGELFPHAIAQSLGMTPAFGKSQPEAARRFVYAFLRGVRDYYHAFNKNDVDRGPAIQSMVAHTPVKDPALYSVIGMQSVDPNAIMDRTSLDVYQRYFVAEGSVPQMVDLEPYIDRAYLNAALDRLGRES